VVDVRSRGAGLGNTLDRAFFCIVVDDRCKPVNLFEQRVVVKDLRHLVLGNEHLVGTNAKGQIEPMLVWFGVVWPYVQMLVFSLRSRNTTTDVVCDFMAETFVRPISRDLHWILRSNPGLARTLALRRSRGLG